MEKLTDKFFNRDTITVARELLGKFLVRNIDGNLITCRITETEAYIGRSDKACHAYGYKRTSRTETLFAKPGTVYVYLIYGMYHCLNLVTEPENEPAAVLIRSLQPVSNLDTLIRFRFPGQNGPLNAYQRKNFLNGPGKLCKALCIDRHLNGADLTGNALFVLSDGTTPSKIFSGPRIGIDYAEEAKYFPWRFWI